MTASNEPRRRPLQNRVTPFGEIVPDPARGTMLGNRGGCMHNAAQRITGRGWVNRRWIACLLEFRGRHREVMTPGRYTELFFLDEATALAAGHRPCAECRRGDYSRFREAWRRAHPGASGGPAMPGAEAMDEVLHASRLGPEGRQRSFRAPFEDIPQGTIVTLEDDKGEVDPFLAWRGGLRRWTFQGYTDVVPIDPRRELLVLTPRATVEAIRAGYVPTVHPSAEL